MDIIHKFKDELDQIENQQHFCGQGIEKENNILVIGTFNPADHCISKPNTADWFYGREESNFWLYVPKCFIGSSLKNSESKWRQFCTTNRIVIVDLIKSISNAEQLEDFRDISLEKRINPDFSNVDAFSFAKAFTGIHFERVIYSRKTWYPDSEDAIVNLTRIRDNADSELIKNGIVDSELSIESCYAPWLKGNYVMRDWENALRKFKRF